MVNTSPTGVQCPDGSVLPRWDAHKRGKDGEYGVPTLSLDMDPLCRGLRLHYYRRGPNTPGESPPLGPLPRVRCRPGGGVSGDPSSGTARGDMGVLDRTPPPPPR